MKKILAVLLLLAVILSVFSGCSKANEPTERETEKETVTEEKEPVTTTEEPAPETETEIHEETVEETTEEETKTEAAVVKEEAYPLDKEKPLTDLYEEDEERFYFHIPLLNCDTEDGKKINREIDEVFCSEARYGFELNAKGSRPMYYEIDYSAHWYGDVLVLILWKVTDNDFHEYRVYNIYRVTGKRMSNDGILRMLKVPKEEFLEGAARGAEAFYRNYYPKDVMGGESMYQEQLDWTVSAENINMDMMMFPSEDGKLMLLSKIGSLIGSSYYEQIYEYAAP